MGYDMSVVAGAVSLSRPRSRKLCNNNISATGVRFGGSFT